MANHCAGPPLAQARRASPSTEHPCHAAPPPPNPAPVRSRWIWGGKRKRKKREDEMEQGALEGKKREGEGVVGSTMCAAGVGRLDRVFGTSRSNVESELGIDVID